MRVSISVVTPSAGRYYAASHSQASALNDAFYNAVSLLLRSSTGAANASNNSTFTDSGPNNFTITRGGNVTQGKFSPYGSVGGSMYFDGTGDYLGVPIGGYMTLGANNFTAEAWVYTTVNTDNAIFTLNSINAGYCGMHIRSVAGGALTIAMSLAGGNWDLNLTSAAGIVPLRTWTHIAVVRSGTTVTVYANGVSCLSGAITGTLMNGVTQNFNSVGKYGTAPGTFPFSGYISDARVVIGTAVYTSTFTPPVAPLTAITNTSVLLSGSGANIVDVTGKSDAETVGSAQVSTAQKTFGTSSVYFNGSTDMIAVPGDVVFGTGDFTIECWIKTSVYSIDTAWRHIFSGGSVTNSPTMFLSGTGMFCFGDDSVGATVTSTTMCADNVWRHVAYSRCGAVGRLFVNGIQEGGNIADTHPWKITTALNVGAYSVSSGRFTGYIDDFRITKGVARYVTDFAVDTQVPVDPYQGASLNLACITSLPAPVTTYRATGSGPATSYLADRTAVMDAWILLLPGWFGSGYNGPHNPYVITTTGGTYGAGQGTIPFTNGNNASTSFQSQSQSTENILLDGSTNNFSVTKAGEATQGTYTPFSNSGFSTYFTGTASGISFPSIASYAIGTGAFTVEFFLNQTVTSTTARYFVLGVNGTDGITFQQNGTNVNIDVNASGGSVTLSYAWTPTLGVWSHIAFTRSGTTLTLYIDGVSVATATSSASVSQNAIYIGGINWGAGYNTSAYISNLRFSNIARTITVPVAPYVSDANTLLLTCQDNRFADRSTNNSAASVFGTAAIQAFTPFTPTAYSASTNGGSLYFDGTGDYASLPYSSSLLLNASNFTIEAWVNPSALPVLKAIAGAGGGTNATANWDLIVGTNGIVTFEFYIGGVANTMSSSSAIPLNAWSHIAIVRNGNVYTMYKNGAQVATTTVAGSINANAIVTNVGCQAVASTTQYWQGYISDFRMVIGTAVYTTAFTPPTAPLTAISGTQVLLKGTGANVYDNTGRVNVVMMGTAKVSTTTKKFNSSIQFDGSAGCYALAGNSTQFTFGTGDFTIEMWAYFNNVTSAMVLFDCRSAQGTYPLLYLNTTGQLFYYVNSAIVITGTALTASTWYHIAVSRVSGSTRLFVNGAQQGSTWADATNYLCAAKGAIIGIDYGLASSMMNGYIEDLRITKGIGRYTSGFTVPATSMGAVTKSFSITAALPATVEPTGGDPYYNQTVLHLHMDGLNGGTNFADQKGHTVTAQGTAVTTTASSKFGAAAGRFNGTAARIYFPETIYQITGDFTFEAWVYLTSYGTGAWIFNSGAAVSSSGYNVDAQLFGYSSTGYMQWIASNGANGATVAVSNPIPLNAWTHVAWSRSGSVTKAFVNGVVAWSGALTYQNFPNYATAGFAIGGYDGTVAANSMIGYMDEFRLTKAARYTAAFTVPTAAFPDYQDFTADPYLKQSVLLKSVSSVSPQTTTFVDNSTNNFPITRFGDTIQYGMSPYASGGSAYFDGTGDYLTFPSSANLALGSGDFTIEFWLNRPALSGGTQQFIFFQTANTFPGLAIDTSDRMFFCINGGAPQFTGTTVNTVDTWRHYALCKSGGTTRLFVNGVLDGSVADVQTYGASSGIIGMHSNGSSFPYKGYMSDLRVVIGSALYTSTFTPPAAPLTAIANTQLLLSMGGASMNLGSYQNNTILDTSTNKFPVTRTGNVAQGTFSPFSNSGFSTYFNGAEALNVSVTGLGSTYMLSGWLYMESTTGTYDIMADSHYSDRMFRVQISNGVLSCGRLWATTGSTMPVPERKWFHFAATVSGSSVCTSFVDGVKGTSVTHGGMESYNNPLTFGGVSTIFFKGYMFDIQLSTTLYTTDYVVPAAPVVPVAATQLAFMRSNRLLNLGNAAVTYTGAAHSIQAFSPFAPSTYSAATNGGSMYFDGTGDYLTIPDSVNLQPGTGDWQLEFWVYPTTNAVQEVVAKGAGIQVYTMGSNNIGIALSSSNTTSYFLNAAIGTLVLNTWHHIVVQRNGSAYCGWVNGISGLYNTSFPTTYANTGTSTLQVGAYAATYFFPGYISDVRWIKGSTSYTANTNFTPPTAPLTAIANTQLLLKGTNAAIVDVTGKTVIETSGNAKTDSVNKRYNSSIKTIAGTDYLRFPPDSSLILGNGNFTIEGWFRLEGGAGTTREFVLWNANATGYAAVHLFLSSSNTVWICAGNGAWTFQTDTGYVPTIGAWTHYAVVRNGTNYSVYIDGVNKFSTTYSGTLLATGITQNLVGANSGGTTPWYGSIEDVRITKGVARYVSNFTIPLASFPAV